MLIDLLCQYLAHCCQNVTSTSLTCFERCFSSPKNVGVLKRLVEDLYVPVQRELAATRENITFVKSLIEDTMAVPEEVKFRLLVTADTVVVKETLDDSSPRTCKLERGTIVDAYERSCGTSGMLKYRTEHGWIPYFRSGAADSVIEVIDLTRTKPSSEKRVSTKELSNI